MTGLDSSVLDTTPLSPFHPLFNTKEFTTPELDYLGVTLQRTLDYAQRKLAWMAVEHNPGDGRVVDRESLDHSERSVFNWMD